MNELSKILLSAMTTTVPAPPEPASSAISSEPPLVVQTLHWLLGEGVGEGRLVVQPLCAAEGAQDGTLVGSDGVEAADQVAGEEPQNEAEENTQQDLHGAGILRRSEPHSIPSAAAVALVQAGAETGMGAR